MKMWKERKIKIIPLFCCLWSTCETNLIHTSKHGNIEVKVPRILSRPRTCQGYTIWSSRNCIFTMIMGIDKFPFYILSLCWSKFQPTRACIEKKKCFLAYSDQFDSVLLDGWKFWSKNVVKCTSVNN